VGKEKFENAVLAVLSAKPLRGSLCTPYISGYETEPMPPDERKAVEEFFRSDEARLYEFQFEGIL
jgi:hypothetical protein